MKKYLAAAGIATAVGLAGVGGFTIVNAATNTSNSTNPMSGLVEAIATKFNLKQEDVQAVIDAERSEWQAQRETQVKAEVAQLVTDGKLTQEQADKINAKRAELQKEREAAMSDTTKTREEMRTEMEAQRTELETWAKDNGIDTAYLRYVYGGGKGFGGGPGGRWGRPDTDSSSSDSSSDSSS